MLRTAVLLLASALCGCVNVDAPTACQLEGRCGDALADGSLEAAADSGLPDSAADGTLDGDAGEDVATDAADGADGSDGETCSLNACGKCAPEVSPLPGAKCGICLTRTATCSVAGLSTECIGADDRSAFVDNYFSGSGGASLGVPAALGIKALHLGSIVSITLWLSRSDVSPPSSEGSLRVRIIKGKPTTTPAGADVLADFSVSASSIPTSAAATKLVLPTPTVDLPLGTDAWIELTDVSPRSSFAAAGDFAPTGAMPEFWAFTGGKFELYEVASPYLVVDVKGCK